MESVGYVFPSWCLLYTFSDTVCSHFVVFFLFFGIDRILVTFLVLFFGAAGLIILLRSRGESHSVQLRFFVIC